jgi:hypothetical protein
MAALRDLVRIERHGAVRTQHLRAPGGDGVAGRCVAAARRHGPVPA